MNFRSRTLWAWVFSLWALIIGGLLYFSSGTKLILFDSEGFLAQKSANMNFDRDFLSWLSAQHLNTRNTVIHFTDATCPCFVISEPHRDSVQSLAKERGFENQFVNWIPAMSDFVPASPAVVVISSEGILLYFGPYSSGAFCTADNGLVEPFIKGERQVMPGAMIVTDAVGCYCAKNES